MSELETALALIRKEITKHEMDLRRAVLRNGTSEEELARLREKIDLKKLLAETILEHERTIDIYRRVLREKLVENAELRSRGDMLTKGAVADGQKGLEPSE